MTEDDQLIAGRLAAFLKATANVPPNIRRLTPEDLLGAHQKRPRRDVDDAVGGPGGASGGVRGHSLPRLTAGALVAGVVAAALSLVVLSRHRDGTAPARDPQTSSLSVALSAARGG